MLPRLVSINLVTRKAAKLKPAKIMGGYILCFTDCCGDSRSFTSYTSTFFDHPQATLCIKSFTYIPIILSGLSFIGFCKWDVTRMEKLFRIQNKKMQFLFLVTGIFVQKNLSVSGGSSTIEKIFLFILVVFECSGTQKYVKKLYNLPLTLTNQSIFMIISFRFY